MFQAVAPLSFYLLSSKSHLSLLESYPETWQVCKMSINLLTLAGLSTNISVDKPANLCMCMVNGQVINLLTLADLRTVFGYKHGLHVDWQFCLYPKSVHKPARVSRFVTLGPAAPKTVHRPARVSRFMT